MKNRWITLILMLCSFTILADEKLSDAELRLSVEGTIEIDPEGRVHDYTIETRLTSSIRDYVDQRVRQWRFEPITVDGRAVIAKTRMRLNLLAQTMGESYVLHVHSVHFGAPTSRERDRSRLRFPPKALRERLGAHVMLALRIDADGNVVDAHPYQTNLSRAMDKNQAARWRRMFEAVAIKAAKRWTYEPSEHIDGAATSATVFAPFEFRIVGDDGSQWASHYWRIFVPGPVAPIPWQQDEMQLAERLDQLKDGETLAVSSRFRLIDDVVGAAL